MQSSAPFMPPQKPPRPPIVSRYGVDYCSACTLMLDYCRCVERSTDAPAKDGDGSDLARRIAAARAKAGGR